MSCVKCSKCCTDLKLEIVELDLIREPRLRLAAIPLKEPIEDEKNPFDRSYVLPNPCPFLNKNDCVIYPTRPNICVAFSDKCLNNENNKLNKSESFYG